MLDVDDNMVDAPEHPPACAVLACVQSYSRRGVLPRNAKSIHDGSVRNITVVTLNGLGYLGASKVS